MNVSEREAVKRRIAWRLVGAFPTGEQAEAVWGALDAMDDDQLVAMHESIDDIKNRA